MAISRSRRRPAGVDYWPGFVDALSTLLLTVTFLMVLFMVAQYFAAQEASGKDTLLAKLQRQIAQLATQLSLERSQKNSALDDASSLRATLAATEAEKKRLAGLLGAEGRRQRRDAGPPQSPSSLTSSAASRRKRWPRSSFLISRSSRCASSSPRLRTRSATPISAIRRRRRRSPISGSG